MTCNHSACCQPIFRDLPTKLPFLLIAAISLWALLTGFPAFAQLPDPLDLYNPIWNSPSTNSTGSMPLGNGDVGLNLWIEQGGDLLFYISKTDAWDEHARLLKLGKVRVALEPNPFATGAPFRQELRLRQGEVFIEAGQTNSRIQVRCWVDALHPTIHIETESANPIQLTAKLENWRSIQRALTREEADGVDRFAKDQAPQSYPDTILHDQTNRIVWFHQNRASIWASTLDHQDLGALTNQFRDPLLGRTFGGSVDGADLISKSPNELVSKNPGRHFLADVHLLTAQPATPEQWVNQLVGTIAVADQRDINADRAQHQQWWSDFWKRSWIRVTSPRDNDDIGSPTFSVSRGYALQRYLNACAGRGPFPIKFNGSIFTVDVPGKFDPDYRRWGGCYWWQNTRLPYWPMLAAGDFDLMRPLFEMYRSALPFSAARTRIYFHHNGAFFPETMHFWGAYHNGEFGYGWNREREPVGRTENRYIRYYWSGALELSALMLDYFEFTHDDHFFSSTLLPLARAILDFYDLHYPRSPRGQLLILPAQSLETWWDCNNPLPENAGLRAVLDRLLALPENRLPQSSRAQWQRLRASLPPLPIRENASGNILLPGETFANQQNVENPELYAIFPYRILGIGKPELALARQTFSQREFKGSRGWQQDDTQAAFLGLASDARKLIVERFSQKDPHSRFPAFWGPNFDWVPDQDHGGNGMMALETMLLQSDDRKLFLLPAWPKDWNAEFKLHAPHLTTVEGIVRAGKIVRLTVTPPERAKDLTVLQAQ